MAGGLNSSNTTVQCPVISKRGFIDVRAGRPKYPARFIITINLKYCGTNQIGLVAEEMCA
uniref:Uncharacterized protein n=1 Tax=Bionectria ochroleuca TaxID=29856 RepID=A0A0B7KSN4_BIOOC